MHAAIATQLTDRASRKVRLNIGGVDVSYPVTSTWRTSYKLDPSTISLTEEGPGGVSSMAFTVADPEVALTIMAGQDVEFWDITHDQPLFLGFIQSFELEPAGPGRVIHLKCIGIECLLDWMLVPALTIPANTHLAAAVQSCVANAIGVGWPVRAFSHAAGSEDVNNDQAHPVAGILAGFPVTQFDVTIDGSSLRSAVEQVIAACNTWVSGTGALATIDFYSGLRVFPTSIGDEGIITTYTPTDYDVKIVTMAMGGTHAPTAMDVNVDVTGVVRAVYILGGNAAGSGPVTDGSGIPGPVAFINDSTSTTAAKRDAIAAAYLSQFSQSVRGTVTVDPDAGSDIWSNDTIHVGGTIFMAADATIWSALTGFTIMSIRKTFTVNMRQTWVMAFGGFPGAASKQLRRLTRTTRS